MSLEKTLEKLGLHDKEAAVYLALLQLGYGSAQMIAKKSKLARPTAYVILDSLIEKGLAQKGLVANKTVFIASPPEDLHEMLEREDLSVRERKKELKRALPELRAIFALAEDKPSIRFFEGKEGIKNLYREFVEVSREPVYGIESHDYIDEIFYQEENEYEKMMLDTRVKAGIPMRLIYTSKKGPYIKKDMWQKMKCEYRYIPAGKLPLKASFAVHGPTLAIISFRNKIIGVLIEHRDIADSFRAILSEAWDAAEKYQK